MTINLGGVGGGGEGGGFERTDLQKFKCPWVAPGVNDRRMEIKSCNYIHLNSLCVRNYLST